MSQTQHTAPNPRTSRPVPSLLQIHSGAMEPPQALPPVRVLEVSSRLQTTLDPEALIRLFAQELQRDLDFAGLQFEHAHCGIVVAIGTVGRHSVEYRLDLDREFLGTLRLTRQRRFGQNDIDTLERLLCGLVYPLRNALLYRQAVHASVRDGLTGAYNRTAFDATVTREIGLAHRHQTPMSLVVLDIDHFKSVNDTHGHRAGDAVLAAFASAVQECIRDTDWLFRYGGEEFVVALTSTTPAGALRVAERIREHIAAIAVPVGDVLLRVTASIGLAHLNAKDTAASLFQRADLALYEAKAQGRNRINTAEGDSASAA